jgi:hypothetical protein
VVKQKLTVSTVAPLAAEAVLTVTVLLNVAEAVVRMLTVDEVVVDGLQPIVVGLATLSTPLLPKVMLHTAPVTAQPKQHRLIRVVSNGSSLCHTAKGR